MTAAISNRRAAAQIPLRVLRAVRPRRARFTEREFWWTQALIAASSTIVYGQHLFFDSHADVGGFHDIPAMTYIAPVMYAALAYGLEGAILTSLWVTVITAPHMARFETGESEWLGTLGTLTIVTVTGAFLAFRVERERDERVRAEAVSERLRLLNELAEVFDRSQVVPPVLQELADRLRRGLRLDFVWVRYTLAREDGGSLYVTSGDTRGLGAPEEIAATTSRALERVQADPTPWQASDGWLAVPLMTERRSLGALGAARASSALDDDERDVLISAAAQASVALENYELQRERREALTSYARQVTRAQEDERRRVARELHDGVTQALSGLCRGLDVLQAEHHDLENIHADSVAELRTVAEQALVDLRRLTRDLRPTGLDDLGLIPALERLASELGERCGVTVTVTKKCEARALSSEQELGVFRIVQEALSNVEKHAHASRVEVRVECSDDLLRVTISDDGRGFETPPDPAAFARAGRYGLLGMQERAALHSGTLSVRSSPGGGTTVALEISAAMPAAAVN